MKAIIAIRDAALSSYLVDVLNSLGVACSSQCVVSDVNSVSTLLSASGPEVLVFLDATESGAALLEKLEQLSRATNASLIVAGASDDPGEVVSFMRAGAKEYIDSRGDLSGEISGLLKRLTKRYDGAPSSGKLITVSSCGGGMGASTIATNLAAILAKEADACGLIDLHPCGGDLSPILQLEPDYTIRELANKGDSLDATLLRKSLVEHSCGIRLLAAPEPFGEGRALPATAITRILTLARREFPYVIVDGEDLFHNEQTAALAESDLVLLVFRLDFASLVRTQKCIHQLTHVANVAKEKVLLVAGRCGQPGELPVERAEKVLGQAVTECIPNDPLAAVSAINMGEPVISELPNSALAKAIERLALCVSGKSNNNDARPKQLSARIIGSAASLLGIASM